MLRKILIPCLLISLAFSLSSFKKKDKKKKDKKKAKVEVVQEPLKIESKHDSIVYIIGAMEGSRLISDLERSQLDSIVQLDKFFAAFEDGVYGKELKINPDSNMQMMNEFATKFREYMMIMPDTSGNKPAFDVADQLMDSIVYVMGAEYGTGVAKGFEQNKFDTIFSKDIFSQGMKDGALKDSFLLDPEANMPMVEKFFSDIQDEKLNGNKKAGEEYLTKNGALDNVTTTESGLQYEIITEGTGALPVETDKVKVHYTGMLVDGTVFDSSIERGQPTTFGVTQVIKGWTEALLLMPVGSKWKVTIPSELAYGENPRPGGPIEPNSVLIFEMELLEIVK